MSAGKMRIYGAGGAGMNIAHTFSKTAAQSDENISAEAHFTYLDTSRSNLKAGMDEKDCYILPADGSGKVRGHNYEKIGEVVKQVMLDHKPMDFNIVVFSGSGGSGSVFGPMVIKELLSRDIPVVAVVVGSDESVIAAENTLKTLKTLEGISRQTKHPVIMHYRHNERGGARSETDGDVMGALSSLSVLFSRKVPEFDRQDIFNFLNYHNVTSVEPRLAALEFLVDDDDIIEGTRPHSVASIYRSPDEQTLTLVPEYHAAGHLDLGSLGRCIHYLIDIESIQRYVARLQKTIRELDEVRSSRVHHKSLVDDNEMDDNGFVV